MRKHSVFFPLVAALAALFLSCGCVSSARRTQTAAPPPPLDVAETVHQLSHSEVYERIRGDVDCGNSFYLIFMANSYEQHMYQDAESFAGSILHKWDGCETELGKEHPKVAPALNNLALMLKLQAKYEEAEPLYKRALEIEENVNGKGHPNVAKTLNNLAGLYMDQAQYEKAERLYKRVLEINENKYGKAHPAVAETLHNLATLYYTQAQYEKAEQLYKRALEIFEIYEKLVEIGEKAVRQAFWRSDKDHFDVAKTMSGMAHPYFAKTLSNLALLYVSQAQYEKAEPLYKRALEINENKYGKDSVPVAETLNNLAVLYTSQAQYEKAEPLYKRALAIDARTQVPKNLWTHQRNVGHFYKDSSPALSIFYYKQSVNTLQEVRAGNTQMDMASQRSFLKSHKGTYTRLADLLFAQNRLFEGQQVLDMLKEAEYSKFSGDDPSLGKADYSPRETEWNRRFHELAGRMFGMAGTDIQNVEGASPESPKYAPLRKEFDAFFEDVKKAFAPNAPGKPNRLDNTSPLQKPLAELGEGVVLIQYLMPQDRLWLLVTTKDGMKARQVDIEADALRKKITAFREAVVSRNPELNKLGKELFDLLVAPAADDLKNVRTLMLAPDGALRYLPFAALHDGEQYLIQRCALANFTAMTMTEDRITARPRANWTFAGFGVSDKVGPLPALPAVKEELEGIRKESLDGEILLDEKFTRRALLDALRQSPPVVHLASHFVFKPGDEQKSFLLTGDGELTLAEIRDREKGYRFEDVDLVALSACDTAMGGGTDKNGREVEGLGVLVQRQGAKGVLASLWPVNDTSTGQFMQLFYGLRRTNPGLDKAEALRRTQLAFIERRVPEALKEVSRGGRKGGRPSPPDHPYHWAPFILMGNWR